MKKTFLLLVVAFSLLSNAFSQPLSINYTSSADIALMQSLLGNGCTNISNVNYIGNSQSFGHFTVNTNNFDIEEGLILSSGYVQDAAGPNNSGSKTTNTLGPSDPLLNSIISQTVYDAARLNYSFISSNDVYDLQFVFGSEEYLEYVNSNFNDVVGIFISGPNPSGGYYYSENIAVFPVSNLPVCVNNVNMSVNSGFYNNNGSGSTPDNEAVQFDGYTTTLNAVAAIVPGATYQVSIIVADASDHVSDAGVFFRLNPSNPLPIQYSLAIDVIYGNGFQLYEGYNANLVFSRNDSSTININIPVDIYFGGNAIFGIDYNLLSTSFVIPAGQYSISTPLYIFDDQINESIEQLIIFDDIGCVGNTGLLLLDIYDNFTFDAGIISDTITICSGTIEITSFINVPESTVSYLWSTGETTSSISYFNSITSINNFTLTVTNNAGIQVVDSVTVINSGSLNISLTTVENPCDYGSVESVVTGGISPYTYQWSNGAETQNIDSVPLGVYLAYVTDSIDCQVSESVNLLSQPSLVNSFNLVSLCTDTFGNIYSNTQQGNSPYNYYWSTGETTSMALGVEPGNYYLTITDDNGCQLIDSVIDFLPTILSVTLNYNALGCDSYEANVIITEGTPPYSISWSDGTGDTLGFSATQPGTYWASVNDAYSCDFYQSFQFVYDPAINFIVPYDVTYDNCGPIYNKAVLNPMPQTGTFTYLWSNGATTDSIYNVDEGLYSVTVTNSYGCSEIVEIYLYNGQLQLDYVSTNITDCVGMMNGTISLSPSGGIPPYTFLWSNVATTSSVENLVSGLYHTTVIDGCLNEYYDSILIEYELIILDLNIDYYSPPCDDTSGTITITELNSIPFTSWLTNNIGDTIQSIYTGVFNNLAHGSYNIFVQDTFLCNTDTFIVELSDSPVEIYASAIPSTILCPGDSVVLIADIQNQVGSDMYFIEVLPVDTSPYSGTSISTNLNDDMYYGSFPIGFDFMFFGELQNQFYVGSNGWMSFSPLSSSSYDPWVVQPIPNTDASRPRNAILAAYRDWNIGFGGDILYHIEGVYPNRRLIVSFYQVPLFSCSTDIGAFQIILYEATGVIDVNLVDVPTCLQWANGKGVSGIQNADGTIACVIDSLNSTAWEASDYRIRYTPQSSIWYDYNYNYIDSGNTITVAIDSSGYYYCETFSCGSTIVDSVYIDVVNTMPTIDFGGNQDMCYGDSLEIDLGSGYTYLWNNLNTTNAIEVLLTGQYSVTVSYGACSISDNVFVNVENLSLNPIYDSSLCNSDTTIVYFDSTLTYIWEDGSTNNVLSLDTSGIYYVTISSTNCVLENSVELSLSNYPVSSLDAVYTICNQAALLDPGIAAEYEWSNGYLGPVLYAVQSNLYNVTMTNGGCSTIDSVMVYAGNSPFVFLGPDTTICEGESVTLTTDNYVNYLWNTGSTNQSIDVFEPNTYWVSVTNSYSCVAVDSINVDVMSNAISMFSFTEAFGTVEFVNQSQNATFYMWDFGDGSPFDSLENPTHTYPTLPYNEFYTVSLLASNSCGMNSSQFDVLIFDIGEIEQGNSLTIYPNPSVSTIYVDQELNINRYEIYNVTGQVLIKDGFKNTIDISQLSAGVYYIKFYTESEQYVKKFVKR